MIGNMKVKTMFFLLVIGMLILSACTPQQNTESTRAEVTLPPAIENYNAQMAPKAISQEKLANDGTHKATFALEGMTCPSCALGIEYQWKQLDGVYDAQINYPQGTGFAVYDTAKLSAEAIAAASTIYPAQVISDAVYE